MNRERNQCAPPTWPKPGSVAKNTFGSVTCLLLVLGSAGCVAQTLITQIPLKSIRETTGQQSNFHTVVPIKKDLSQYRRLVVMNFDNLMADVVPVEALNHLNDEMFNEMARRKMFSQVVRAGNQAEWLGKDSSTLILDGVLDDYEDGSRGLRVPEMGLNYAIVTIRIRLRDGQTAGVVGSASISIYERGVSRTVESAMNKAVQVASKFIARSAGPESAPQGQAEGRGTHLADR